MYYVKYWWEVKDWVFPIMCACFLFIYFYGICYWDSDIVNIFKDCKFFWLKEEYQIYVAKL